MLPRLWQLLVGSPLPTFEMAHKRLNRVQALVTLLPGALPSIVYIKSKYFLKKTTSRSSETRSILIGCIMRVMLSKQPDFREIEELISYPSI